MKHFKTFLILAAIVFTCTAALNAQQTVPNSWGKGDNEQEPVIQQEKLPLELLEKLNRPDAEQNAEFKAELNKEVDRILGAEEPADLYGIKQTSVITSSFNNPPFNPEWYTSDVLVYTGAVASAGGYRQLDLKRGEDGWMYYIVNKAGTPGQFSIFMSTNGGATWAGTINYSAGSGYIHNISAVVDSRSNAVPDSTRILVYFTFSSLVNGDNASLYVLNVKRNGVGGVISTVGNPAGGNKYEYVSACSDGMYWESATYQHAVVREATNAGVQVGIRHFRTTNWGTTHTSALLSTSNNDYYPSASFSVESGTDSVYIAVERRVSSTEYELRMIVTPDAPSTNFRVFYITSAVSGVKYERPALTIVQQSAGVPKKVLVTTTRNRNPRYCYSADGGGTWTIDALLGPNTAQVADYTICNSDSLTSGGQYIIGGYVTDDGDSVNVRQGAIPGGFSFSYYKRNSNQSSGVVAPVCAIYKTGSTKYAVFGYPGFGPTNAYYNGEQLFTGVEPISSNTPDKFSLSQNYPNPFNPVTNINFALPKAGSVKLVVFDMTGREVAVLVNGQYTAGTYRVDYDASSLASGVYFYRLETESFTDVKKMMLIK
ncbi:MAG: T9SS type A sorting domain-containing protein [Ignavibacteria bacterium]|nr:T9SS type A sorting domain-containing protein [Ignavibacteria bacterium]